MFGESVESVETGGGTVGDDPALGAEGRDPASLAEGLWGRGDADHPGAHAVEDADVEQPPLAVPTDAVAAQVIAGGDAVVVVQVPEEFAHARGGHRGARRAEPAASAPGQLVGSAAEELGFARAVLEEALHPDLAVLGAERLHEEVALDEQTVSERH